MMKRITLAVFALLILSSDSHAKKYITEPLLVPQSPYAGITFYVYRPYNMPEDWYITLDGYPVRKNDDGTWVYGTSEGPNLVATNYVVGSVVPGMAGITKWISDAQISELRKLPTAETFAVRQKGYTRNQMAQGKKYSTYIPDWTFSPTFMAIGNWKGTVDRIGVLTNPAMPVAWSGKNPKVIYAWTGTSWHQINVKGEWPNPFSALKSGLYDLMVQVNRSGAAWRAGDTAVLLQYVAKWGYGWMGQINLLRPSWPY